MSIAKAKEERTYELKDIWFSIFSRHAVNVLKLTS